MDTGKFLSLHYTADTNSKIVIKRRPNIVRFLRVTIEGLAPAILLVTILVIAAALAAKS